MFPETFLILFSIPFWWYRVLLSQLALLLFSISTSFVFQFQHFLFDFPFHFLASNIFITRYSHVYQLASWIHFVRDNDNIIIIIIFLLLLLLLLLSSSLVVVLLLLLLLLLLLSISSLLYRPPMIPNPFAYHQWPSSVWSCIDFS